MKFRIIHTNVKLATSWSRCPDFNACAWQNDEFQAKRCVVFTLFFRAPNKILESSPHKTVYWLLITTDDLQMLINWSYSIFSFVASLPGCPGWWRCPDARRWWTSSRSSTTRSRMSPPTWRHRSSTSYTGGLMAMDRVLCATFSSRAGELLLRLKEESWVSDCEKYHSRYLKIRRVLHKFLSVLATLLGK